VPATLTWLDHDSSDRDRMNRILALFRERDTRDELGVGVIRDLSADEFFPGTSTIQTRLNNYYCMEAGAGFAIGDWGEGGGAAGSVPRGWLLGPRPARSITPDPLANP
jgi:hypothetical protein